MGEKMRSLSVLKLGEVDTQPNRSKDLRASGARVEPDLSAAFA